MKKLKILTLLLIFINCSTTPQISNQQIMESWMGGHKSALIQQWGPPNRITTDGQGGEIYIYESSSTSATTFNNVFGVELNNPVTTLNTNVKYRQFYINRNGKIYYWRSKGY